MSKQSGENEKTGPVLLRTCSVCNPFCASWSVDYLCSGGVKYTGGRHAHHIYDRYHQGYWSDSDSESEGVKQEPTKIGPGSDGCTIEQRVALLCSLYKIASEESQDFDLFTDPKFLKHCFKDLLHDQDKTITFAVFYSCNKIMSECYALPRKHSIAEIENRVGKLEAYGRASQDEDGNESEEESFVDECPYQVMEIYADEAQLFVLTQAQWKVLRNEVGCIGCPLYMSVFTYHNKDSVDVKSILKSMDVI